MRSHRGPTNPARRAPKLDAGALGLRAAEAYVRPYLGDVRRMVASWCDATGESAAASVAFLGPRDELARFFPTEALPRTDQPLVVVVYHAALGDLFVAAGYPGFAARYTDLVAAPSGDGAQRVIVLSSVALALVRVWPAPGGPR